MSDEVLTPQLLKRIRKQLSPAFWSVVESLRANPTVPQKRLIDSGGFVCEDGKPITNNRFRHVWRKALRKAGITSLVPPRPTAHNQQVNKSHADWLTYNEAAYELGVTETLIAKWHVGDGHPSLGESTDGESTYKRIRSDGSWTDPGGRERALLHPEDIETISKWRKNSKVNGHTHISTVLTKHGLKYSFLSHCIESGLISVHWEPTRTGDGRFTNQRHLNDHEVQTLIDRINKADAKWKGHLDCDEFAEAIGYDAVGTVIHWLERGWCNPLHRPLNWKTAEVFVPSKRLRDASKRGQRWQFIEKRLIKKDEAKRIVAVDQVWIVVSEVAEELDYSLRQLQRACRDKRIHAFGIKLGFDNCRSFARKQTGPLKYRLHASVIRELAKALGKPAIAAKYTKRLNQYGEPAEHALRHWTRDEPPAEQEQATEPDPPAPTTKRDKRRKQRGREPGTGKHQPVRKWLRTKEAQAILTERGKLVNHRLANAWNAANPDHRLTREQMKEIRKYSPRATSDEPGE